MFVTEERVSTWRTVAILAASREGQLICRFLNN
jgi:hypothetical protein